MNNNNTEIWKDVVGFEGLYKVSSLGNILRLPKTVKRISHGDIFYSSKLLRWLYQNCSEKK